MPRVVWTEHRPKLKFHTDQLAERISWTMAGLPTRTVVDTISRIWKSRHHISTPKKLMEMFPVQSVPISTPQTLTPQGLLPRRLRPSKVRAARWQTIWNSTMARNVEINFLHPKSGRWKPTIFCAQKDSTNPTNLSLRVKDLFNAWPPHFPGLNDFVSVCYALCLKIPVQSVPISTPQNIGTSVSIATAASA